MTQRLMKTHGALPGRDWCRSIWVSKKARDLWKPRVEAVASGGLDVDAFSVLDGIRPSALTSVAVEMLPSFTRKMTGLGLEVLPMEARHRIRSYVNSTSGGPPEVGEPTDIAVVLTKPEHREAWYECWEKGDDVARGALLGYPSCCVGFFVEVWQHSIDTTWEMCDAPNGSPLVGEEFTSGPPECSMMLRWMGVRLAPHLPCSFNCTDTVQLGQDLAQCARDHGLDEEIGWAYDLLQMPVLWSAKSGIAEITTPICKTSTRCAITWERYEVRRAGDFYPEHGARGNEFPFRPSTKVRLMGTRSFKEGLAVVQAANPSEAPRAPTVVTEAYAWQLNGFGSLPAQRSAHGVVLAVAKELFADFAPDAIIDLGCGEGTLLRRLQEECTRIGRKVPGIAGVDLDDERIQRAKREDPELGGRWHTGDIFDLAWADWALPDSTLVVISIVRLFEAPPEKLPAFLEAIQGTVLLASHYADNLRAHPSVVECFSKLGIEGAVLAEKLAYPDGEAVAIKIKINKGGSDA